MSGPDGFDQLRAMRDGAQEVTRDEPPPLDDAGGPDAPEDTDPELPAACPVVPLGVNNDLCYYLDQLGQLRALKAKDHSRLNVQSLFGRRSDLLYDFWPRKTQDKATQAWHTTGWKPELAAENLMGAAAVKGVWSPQERVRGAGAWSGRDGELILHVGDRLMIVPAGEKPKPGRWWIERDPGLVGNMVYPTAAAAMRPHLEPQPMAGGKNSPADEALSIFKTWNWRRKDIDPYLLLGWIGNAMLGGACNWRALAWTTGGFGTGKSSLQKAVQWTLGENGVLQASDATAAAVRQIVKHASLPVALDETEAEEDNRKMNQLIKLARDAASGSLAIRGGQDHEAAQFTVRSCFLFTSILIPPLLPQDRSRMAILELDQLEADQVAPTVTPRRMGEIGAKLLRRLVDNWHRMPATIEAYRNAMGRAGHSARGQDVFGTLLSMADLLLYDHEPDSDSLEAWQQKLQADTLAELESDLTDEKSCLGYLLSTMLEAPHDRMRYPIGRWIGRVAGREDGLEAKQRDYANKTLQEVGLKIVQVEGEPWLAVANVHRGLAKLFEGTQWGSRPGAQGVWVQSLRRLPHKVPAKALWFGCTSKATLLPLHICLPAGGSPPNDNGSAAGPSLVLGGDDVYEVVEARGRRAADADRTDAGGDPDPDPGAR